MRAAGPRAGGVSTDGIADRWRAGKTIMDDRPGESKVITRRAASALVATAVLALMLPAAGCTSLRQWWHNGFKVGPNYEPPAGPVAWEWIDSSSTHIKSDPVEDCAWWTTFGDPTLNGLIDAAYRQNLDVRTAGARILEARAQRAIAVGNLFPQSQTAISAYVHGQVTQNLNIPVPSQVNLWADGFNASWELDFWGRYRRAIENADANLSASVERYGESLVLLLSEVATSYVQMRTFEQRLAYAEANVLIQERTTKLAEDRLEHGTATELDVRQARSNLAQTRSLIPPLKVGRRQAANRLCILLGTPVNDLANAVAPGPIPSPPVEIAVGIPADLVRRRPDVRRAEREVAAQSAEIGVAEADLYPRLALNGFLGYAANDLQDLFTPKSFTAFIIPSLQWNVLNYGRIANNIRTQNVRLQTAALDYQQAVLTAGREVEDALVQFIETQVQVRHLEDSVEQSRRSVELVVLQFEGGITDFNRVFNAQSTLVTQQDQLAQIQGTLAQTVVELYRALGGGWPHFLEGHGMPALVEVEPLGTPPVPPEEIPPGNAPMPD